MSVRQRDAFAPEQVRDYDNFAGAEEPPAAELTAGLTSLRFIGRALRRRAWLWCATAVAGLVIGLGLLRVLPPAYQASTSVLLTHNPTEDPGAAINTDLTLSQTRAVAQGALGRLGLRQSVGSLLAAYTVTIVTDRVLLITVNAPSSNEAVRRGQALAAEFLQFRADALHIQQRVVLATVGQQIAVAGRLVKSTTEGIAQLPAQPASATQPAALHHLQALQQQANVALAGLEQTAASYPVITAAMVAGSGVLDAAAAIPRPHQVVRFYLAAGFFVGLVLGLGIVMVGALASDRLRRRDDVAYALGAPVSFSVGSVHSARWLPGQLRLAAARGRDMRRIGAHLRRAVRAGSARAELAVVSLDNAQVVALSLVSLAVSCAVEGQRVLLADLTDGAPAARLLGVREPGVREVCVHDARLVVAVPDRHDVAPVGPLRPAAPRAQAGSATEDLASAYESADLLLTLVTLNPALGAEHVATWATDVIVVVTAGRSPAAKIHAVRRARRGGQGGREPGGDVGAEPPAPARAGGLD